jgi:hypothetical protein
VVQLSVNLTSDLLQTEHLTYENHAVTPSICPPPHYPSVSNVMGLYSRLCSLNTISSLSDSTRPAELRHRLKECSKSWIFSESTFSVSTAFFQTYSTVCWCSGIPQRTTAHVKIQLSLFSVTGPNSQTHLIYLQLRGVSRHRDLVFKVTLKLACHCHIRPPKVYFMLLWT